MIAQIKSFKNWFQRFNFLFQLFINFIFKFIGIIKVQNFNIMGHIKISQIRIHLIKKNIEKYIRTCVTGHFPYDFRKTDLGPNAEVPLSRHDEYGSLLRFSSP